MNAIQLRPSTVADIHIFFEYQLDKIANYMAAFTAENPQDKIAYLEKYTRLLHHPTVNMQTIVKENAVVGTVTKFEINNEAEIAFWIDKNCWGRGIATDALKIFLEIEAHRPLMAHVAFDNFGSQTVLTNCGFPKIGIEKGFANARQMEIVTLSFKLDN